MFNEENLLKLFEYLTLITLYLYEFIDIFSILQYTPNLIYLNVKTTLSDSHKIQNKCINIISIKLKQLYLTLYYETFYMIGKC
ncbi:unnamed protein product [Adineta steineri]|uniref:Uncharacterized protein n=1 Tax=Adineta steineri TaxID=433720 RepID=A0A815E4W9_9BILA|nr:unnamed protein product [Adineta steineri]CAF1305302.1 unnamed protein product [Adineta steineri]